MISESVISAAVRAQQSEAGKVGNCGRIWHVAFFFDGVGRNIDRDATDCRLSNIARLFRAYPDEQKNTGDTCYNKFYFSGMGTAYHDDSVDNIHALMDIGLDNFLEDMKSLPEDTISDAGESVIKGEKKWTDVLGNLLEDLNNPVEWVKGIGKMAAKSVGKAGIESTPWLRDSEAMSAYFMTGEPVRLEAAKRLFKKFYTENMKGDVPIKKISVSLYGFDLGATLARKFLDNFLKEVCLKNKEKKHQYKNALVDIAFIGLFDCSRHSPTSSNNGLDYFFMWLGLPGKMIGSVLGEKAIDQDSPLPDVVNNALHLVAAHERRPWRGLYLLGKKTDTANKKYREELLPGCSEDIGGGLKPDEQKPSAELCRVALYNMYHAACQAGVPFPDFDTLDQYDTKVASYFIMNDAVQGGSVNYWVSRYQREEVKDKVFSEAMQEKYLDNYFLWLGEQYYMYQYERERLDKELTSAHRGKISDYGPLAGTGINPNTNADDIKSQISELDSLWGWLNDVKSVAIGLRNDFIVNPRKNDSRIKLKPQVYNAAVNRAVKFLEFSRAVYNDKNLPSSSSLTANTLYSFFVHDIQKVDHTPSISEDFFLRRSSEIPDADEPPGNKDDGKKHTRRDD